MNRAARALFGASSVVAGVVGVLWHGSDLWQQLHSLAWCIAIAQIAGGIALIYDASAHVGAIVLALVYAALSLLCVPAMIEAPRENVNYVNFFEKFSMLCGAIAACAVTLPPRTQSIALSRILRVGFGVCALSFAWAQAVYLRYTASLVPSWIPPNQMFWTIFTTIAFALAAVAILTNIQARLALRMIALMLALFGILVWLPRIIAQPQAFADWDEIAANYLMMGAAWVIAELAAHGWDARLERSPL